MTGAASPTPDLSLYLAPAPASDWLPSAGSQDLVGVITAQSYGAWVGDNGTSESALGRDGFVTGYGLAWEQKVTQDYLSEFVLEFDSADGAARMYNDLKIFDQTSKYYEKQISALPIENSVGAQWKFQDGSREFAIEFAKGNLVYDVTMQANKNDLAATTLAQARTEYDRAPANLNVSSTIPTGPVPVTSLAITFLVIAAGTALIIFVRSRQRRPSYAAQIGGLQMSPDGALWWDGARWRDARTEVPPNAQRSPDGVYWWDGRTWRRPGS